MNFDPSKDPIRAVLAYCVLINDYSKKKKYQLAKSMLKHQFGVDYLLSLKAQIGKYLVHHSGLKTRERC